ncbi:UDP-glucose/GDP-mannose dehydrogenase family protein [Candidatus Saccharibacteria bacterium]|jgi:UDPglucose 6-dehydrogenase|nr:UDP-glucose/GDP-mannose dehydrogenase family protein [Candidatus Saccharibacteria bacterium]
MKTTITVLGAGYVGLTTAALFAQLGCKVYVVEPNSNRLATIKSGKSFFYEDGLDTLIADGILKKHLIPTDSYSQSIPMSDIVFSCVGTPDHPDGSSNLTYVFTAAKQASELMKPGTIYVQKSTVPVGTGDIIIKETSIKKSQYISNPEFLREGTALIDTLWFDRVVCGGTSKKSLEAVINLYKELQAARNDIAKRARLNAPPNEGRYITTNLTSAELIKVTANAFLALKISFANSIAKLSDAVGADINEVMDAVGEDKRIGRAFLNAGRGYGGGCFPKDVSGLIMSGLDHGVDLGIMRAAQDLNNSMPSYVVERLKEKLGGSLTGKKIAVLGMAFKKGTSDTRKSPGIKIANLLDTFSASVHAYDPQAKEEAQADLRRGVTLHESHTNAITGCDAVIIATEWDEFSNIPAEYFAKHLSEGALIMDAVNIYTESSSLSDHNLAYMGIGR